MLIDKMCQRINLNCENIKCLTLEEIAAFDKKLFVALRKMDTFLLNSLKDNVYIEYNPDTTFAYFDKKLNYEITSSTCNDDYSQNVTVNYLKNGRKAILTFDYNCENILARLSNVIKNMVAETDHNLMNPKLLFEKGEIKEKEKLINQIELARVIEKVTGMKKIKDCNIIFKVIDNDFMYDVKNYNKILTAKELLGGNFIDPKTDIIEFTVGKVPINNIEKRCELLLDGKPKAVFIVDKKWIAKYDDTKKIKFGKDDIIRARVKIEISPVTKKPVVYYLVEILSPWS
jgi:hypothetical protein